VGGQKLLITKNMIDANLILKDPEVIQKAAKDKGVVIDVKSIAALVNRYKDHMIDVQKIREERNEVVKKVQSSTPEEKKKYIDEGRKIKEQLDEREDAMKKLHDEMHTLLTSIPNPSKPDVKVGKNDTENDVIKTVGEPTKFNFQPKDHIELGELLDIIDVQRAAKVSGARFAYLKNEGVLLELGLVQYAMETLMKEGFTPVIPPVLIKKDSMQGMGYMENGGEEDMFKTANDDLYLVGTAEQALVPMFRDETLDGAKLPLRFAGYSPAFRREAGSYGKDTKGILRVHQFDKVEMVSFVKKEEDDKEHEYLLGLEEKFFKALKIPYQIVKMCTGDLGFPAARKYDIEAWMPAQDKYREVTSVSTVTDFQSRRLKIRYRDGDKTELAYVLNGTAFAIGRTIIAILENFQQEDGSVVIPEVLRKYVGKEKITSAR
jgi:seryl-tRNA synthetase